MCIFHRVNLTIMLINGQFALFLNVAEGNSIASFHAPQPAHPVCFFFHLSLLFVVSVVFVSEVFVVFVFLDLLPRVASVTHVPFFYGVPFLGGEREETEVRNSWLSLRARDIQVSVCVVLVRGEITCEYLRALGRACDFACVSAS